MSGGKGGPRKCSDAFTRNVLRVVLGKGWRVRDTRSGWVLLSPDGVSRVTLHSSESRSGHKMTAERLKAHGVTVQL